MIDPTIYSFIRTQENAFETQDVRIADNWEWNFRNHVQLLFHLSNGVFYTGENNWMRAFKNIMEPVLELCSWTEDIEVKDVNFFIEKPEGKILSFLVKKYHDEVYTREHDLDKLFDDIIDSDLLYGGVLVQKGKKEPEVLKLNSVAFCDQTNILGGPIGFKFDFSPDKLRSMSKFGWGEESNGATISLEDLVTLALNEKAPVGDRGKKNNVPGKVVEVYIVRGTLPEAYLKDNANFEDHYNQLQIVAFYTKEDFTKEGVTLYRRKENEGSLKFFTSKEVYQRALGRGVGEALLHPQIWTNFLTIHKMNMLEAGSKVPLQTTDPNYTTKNKIQDMENLEVTVVEEGKEIRPIQTIAPANIQLFATEINTWYDQAQLAGAAFDPLMGKEASSGTTFRGQERVVAQGKGSHEKRRGKRAKFIEEIYRDWIIPDMVREILKGREFLATLSTDELMWVGEQTGKTTADQQIREAIIDGKTVSPEQRELLTKFYKDEIIKRGNKQLVEILEGEFDGIEINIGINVAGKQKDLAGLSDKYLSIFQFILQNPEGFISAMKIPAMAEAFENILEFGGMSIADFASLVNSSTPSPMMAQQQIPTNV